MPTQRTQHTSGSRRNPGNRKTRKQRDAEHKGEDERHPLGAPVKHSGTLASLSDTGHAPVADPGMSVDPEDLGTQFLRDATEQDNFESAVDASESELGDVPFGQVISSATLEASGQETLDLPESGALANDAGAGIEDLEITPDVVDMVSTVVHEASLFDEPTERGGTRAPRLETDEVRAIDQHDSAIAVDPEAREREKEAARKRLHKAKDRRDVQADGATWEGNRRSPNERPRENAPGMKAGARGKRE